jgi:TolA-binding protein
VSILSFSPRIFWNKSALGPIRLGVCSLLFFFLLTPEAAFSIPTLKDHWHFFCSLEPFSKRSLSRAKRKKDKVAKNALDQGINILDYACLLHQYEFESFVQAMNKFEGSGGSGRKPTLNNNGSNALIREAAQQIKIGAAEKKNDPRALYYHGYVLALSNDPFAVNVFDTLMTKYKSSKYTQMAYLALGEFYFDNQDIPKANREYKTAQKSKDEIVKKYVMYKLAWIEFLAAVRAKNRSKQKAAITKFATLTKGDKEKKGYGKKLDNLIERDLLDMLVELGDFNEAKRILKNVGATAIHSELLERLAYAKLNGGDARGAYNLFQQAIKEDETAVQNLQRSVTLVNLAAEINDVNLLIKSFKSLMALHGNTKSNWYKKQSKSVRKKALAQVEKLLFEFAITLERQGHANNNQAYLAGSMVLCQMYIKAYPKTKNTYDATLVYAQLLYEKKQYKKTAAILISLIKKNPKGKLNVAASDLMITSSQIVFDSDKKNYKLPELGKAETEMKIPGSRRLFADALALYMKLQPRNDNVPAMMYTEASIYYDFGHYKKAVDKYFRFVSKYPTNEFSLTAAARVFVYYDHWKNKRGIAKAKSVFGKFPNLKSAPELSMFFSSSRKKSPSRKSKKKIEAADKDEEA